MLKKRKTEEKRKKKKNMYKNGTPWRSFQKSLSMYVDGWTLEE